MLEFFQRLLDPTGFPARWNCGLWTSGHGWLHIIADIGVWSAYTAIPLTLAYFILRRRDMPFPRVFWLFAAFIFSCGATHLIDATMFWWPAYRLSGMMKLTTAVISWATVAALIPIMPRALALPGLAAVNQQLTEREKAYRELSQSLEKQVAARTAEAERRAEQLRALATQVTQAGQQERHRLSLVLHDDLQQLLVAARMRLDLARNRGDDQGDDRLKQVDEYLQLAVDQARNLAVELSPPALSEGGLPAGLAVLAQQMRQQHQLHVDVHIDLAADLPDQETGMLLYQATRELLFNAVKHGKARRADVHVRSVDGELELIVRDEGAGFDAANTPPSSGFGLSHVRQQLQLADGELTIQSESGQGTVATIRVPLERLRQT